MTTVINIDCSKIQSIQDFYDIFTEQSQPEYPFGANLDALWDIVTTELALPITINFNFFRKSHHAYLLNPVINLLAEAQVELNNQLQVDFPKASSH